MYKQGLLLLSYNKDVLCVVDKGKEPQCSLVLSLRRDNQPSSNSPPSYDPYIPREHSVFYNCTASTQPCVPLTLNSLIQVALTDTQLKACFRHSKDFECENVRYHHFKNIDKLLFLSQNIKDKKFYLVDCLAYEDQGRVCHRKEEKGDSHAKLVDTGAIARPNEKNVLSQNEFICEESLDKEVTCDIDSYVPYDNGLRLKETVKMNGDVLLQTGGYVVIMKKKCVDAWCGYGGKVTQSRRSWFPKYDPPGGKTYRCYYAKRQQVCKESPLDKYNKRDWFSD